MNDAIRVEASAILAAAVKREPVELERLQVFATACLRASRIWRLCQRVSAGGEFASRHAVELATLVLRENPADADSREPVMGRPLPPLGCYFCPECELDLLLTEPCQHIEFSLGGENERSRMVALIRAVMESAGAPRCRVHDQKLVNSAFFECGCRFVSPPTEAGPTEDGASNPDYWGGGKHE